MKRQVAERIADAMKEVERALVKLDHAILEVEDEAQRKLMRDTLYKTVHFFHAHISVPVARHHPDLHPDVPGSTKY
ncbi:MAG TPA: hypothetical protein VFB13_14850 [Reyranella sp.]|jgi:hypothetical protein|nr:hypothetical protein [Reyranella sp.]